jgi:hypothetical protein
MDAEALLAELASHPMPTTAAGLTLTRRPPASEADIDALRARLPLPLVGSLVEVLRVSDGLDLFGVEVFGTRLPESTNEENVRELYKRRLVPFHDWGNGDFDCLDLTKVVDGETPVAFWNDEMENVFPITHNFARWARASVVEIELYGRLLHPRDYFDPRWENAQGVYESIANVKKTFYGGPELAERTDLGPGPRRRDKVLGFLKRRLGRG